MAASHGLLVSPFAMTYQSGAKIAVPAGPIRVFLTSGLDVQSRTRPWKLEQTVDVPPGQEVSVGFTVK